MTVFDLDRANRLLPKVQALTDDAARRADEVIAQAQLLAEGDSNRLALEQRLRSIVEEWSDEIEALGLVAKGLWVVDFDNGAGYWCWKHPEPTLEYQHSYEEDFAGRRLIAPEVIH